MKNTILLSTLFVLLTSLSVSAKVDGNSIPEILVAGTEITVRIKNADSTANPFKVVLFTEDGNSFDVPSTFNSRGNKAKILVPSLSSGDENVYRVTLNFSGGNVDENSPEQFIRFLTAQSSVFNPTSINPSLQGNGVTLPEGLPGLLGDSGATGPQGPQGPAGQDSPVLLTLFASRDYDSSAWFNYETTAPVTGSINPPDTVTVASGNTGTGWLSLQIGSNKACYQGTAGNNSQISRQFSFAQIISSGVCDNPGSKIILSSDADYNIPVSEGDTIGLEVNGGGVSSSIRTYTSVVIPNLLIEVPAQANAAI